MPEPVAEPALNGLRLNLRIVSVVIFNFASYLTIGLPLAVLPGYVHDVMGFSAFWAGLVISLQYFATLLSRPHAGRYADLQGPKKIVVFGLGGCFLSGLSYLLAAWGSGWPLISLLLLCLGRVILGIGQSFAGTGSTLWGVGVVGSLHIGRVISWNGIVTYGAMAMGAPLGVLCYSHIGLSGLAGGHYGGSAGGYPLRAAPRGGEGCQRQSDVVSRGARPGLALRHGAGVGLRRLWGDRHLYHAIL